MKKTILLFALAMLAGACAWVITLGAQHKSAPEAKPKQAAEIKKTSVVDQGFRTTTRGLERIENTRLTPGVTEVPR